MNFQPIQSEANAKFKRWKRILESTRVMRKEGVTLAEGAHLVQVVLERGVKPLAVLLRAKGINEEAEGLLAKLAQKRVPLYVLDTLLYDQLSPVEHGAGIMVEVALPENPQAPESPVDALYLDGVQDPGNIGTLVRTAVASGIKHIAASKNSAHFFSPKALRAGMGAHFAATIYENVEPTELKQLFKGRILAADARGGQDLFEEKAWSETATTWMMGSEGQGISQAALDAADQRLYIPIEHDCESLNVAAAAAVCLFEQRRRRLMK